MGILEAATQRMKMEEANYEARIAALQAELETVKGELETRNAEIAEWEHTSKQWDEWAKERADRLAAAEAQLAKREAGEAVKADTHEDVVCEAVANARKDAEAQLCTFDRALRMRVERLMKEPETNAEVKSGMHPDDIGVDRFSDAMKAKLAKKRAEGRGGWDNRDECTAEHLSYLLVQHIIKGDPLDVGNLAMMLHQRGDRIVIDEETRAIFPRYTHPAPTHEDGSGEVTEATVTLTRSQIDALLKAAYPFSTKDERSRTLEAALSHTSGEVTEAMPRAFLVHDMHVPRMPVKAKGRFPEPTEHLYPASREDDAKEMARMMRGTCTPLFAKEDSE